MLVSGYRPPNCNVRTFLKEYTNLITNLRKNKHHEIIIGIDHNLDLLKANTHSQINEFLELNLRKSLLPCISKPTRITHTTVSLIDNVMANPILQSDYSPYMLVDDLSDHIPIIVKFRNQNKSMKGLKTVRHHKLDASVLDKIKADISKEDWYSTFSSLDANKCFDVFHKKLAESIEKHAPEKTLRVGRKNLIRDPWITSGIMKSLRKQKQL